MESSYNGQAAAENQHESVDVDASRPSLGFPLGTALLLIVIFSLSGIFSCCYHWDKIKSLRRSLSDDDDNHQDLETDAAAAAGDHPKTTSPSSPPHDHNIEIRSLPVIMPGDRLPKFIAMPCPCQPPRPAKNLFIQPLKPLKPPPAAVSIPFY